MTEPRPRFPNLYGATVLILAMLLLPATAADLPRERDRWTELVTDNFTFFSNAADRTVRRVAADLEDLRAVLSNVTGFELTSPMPIFVYVFKHGGSFEPYKHLYAGRPAATAGYFSRREQANYIAIDASAGDDASSIVYHEYVHYVASTHLPNLPLWFEEGLAELYQTFSVSGSEAHIGLPLGRHLGLLRTTPMLPLTELFAVDHGSPVYNEAERKGAFYAESWALVHYLLIGSDQRRLETSRFLALLQQGTPPATAFDRAYAGGVGEIEKEFRSYIERRIFRYLQVPVAEAADHDAQLRAMSYPDVLFRLGDLLMQQDPPREDEAAAHFATAVEIDPSHGPSLAAMGRLAEDHARWQEAESLYRRALAAAPDDALVQYRGGAFLLRRGGDLEAARDALRRSTALQPGYAPAWVALAGSFVAAGATGEEAVHAAERAHELLPGRTDVTANLLRQYLAVGRRGDAVALAETAFATAPADREMAFAVIARSDLERARALIADGRDADAAAVLDQAEAAADRAPRSTLIGRQIEVLRANAEEQRLTARYNEAVAAYNDGRVDEARALLRELRADADGTRHAEAADAFLSFIDDPGSGLEPPSNPQLTEASVGEIDRLNELLRREQLDEALLLLEDLRQRVGSGRRTWIDAKMDEIRRVLDHNRFVEAYNRAVEQYNGRAYADAVATLESLLAAQPTAPEAASARELLAEARAALADVAR